MNSEPSEQARKLYVELAPFCRSGSEATIAIIQRHLDAYHEARLPKVTDSAEKLNQLLFFSTPPIHPLETIQLAMDAYATEREKELREALEWALNRGIGETNWTAADFDKWDKYKALSRPKGEERKL